MPAKLGGFARIRSAANARFDTSSGPTQARQQPSSISPIIVRCLAISPELIVFIDGSRPGLLTAYASSASGSPPIDANSMPCPRTKSAKRPCVAIRTR